MALSTQRTRYASDASLDDRAACLVDQLFTLETVRDWKNALKRELASPTYALDAFKANPQAPLRRVLESLGLVSSLKRVVIDLHDETMRVVLEAAKRQADEEEATLIPHGKNRNELDVVAVARTNWENITRDELLRFASEQDKPLLMRRASDKPTPTITTKAGEEEEGTTANTKPSKPPSSTRFLYDSNDLLHILQAIQPTNRAPLGADAVASWGSVQLQFHTPSTLALCRTYAELAPSHGQIGVDESFPIDRAAFLTEKLRIGDLVCRASHSVAMARQYAKTGCPTSLRAAVWRQALGLGLSTATASSAYFETLEEQTLQWQYVTDDMYALDLQRAVDSSDYFVFQDPLERVVKAFTRDADVLARAPHVNGAVRLSDAEFTRLTRPSHSQDEYEPRPVNAVVPPNGVLPFSGLVLYVAPLAYVYGDAAEPLYFVFRELYVRFWSRLNAVPTILPLCHLFEALVQRSTPAAVLHLTSVGVSPLSIAFPWLQAAFSGVLEIQQLLLLWDRVLGFDSLELLAVFAAALFHWRASEWECVTTIEEAHALYTEILDVQAVPLLQEYLFLLS